MAATQSKNNGKQGARYSKTKILKALAVYDVEGTVKAAAKAAGVTEKTVNSWIKDRDKYLPVSKDEECGTTAATALEVYNRQKDKLLSKNIELQSKALEQIEKRLPEASAAQAATIYGILHDKVNGVMRDNPAGNGNTTNIILSNMGEEQATALMARVIARAQNGQDVTK